MEALTSVCNHGDSDEEDLAYGEKAKSVSFDDVLTQLQKGNAFVFHNDFKIDNVMIREDNSVVIIDWDLAHPWLARIAVHINTQNKN